LLNTIFISISVSVENVCQFAHKYYIAG